MSIVLVGLNHRTAPVEVRERLAFSEESCRDGLRHFVDGNVVEEGLIVSTCNRVEIVSSLKVMDDKEGLERVTAFLSSSRSIARKEFDRHLYYHSGEVAVRHLFRVASSLDSMVVGEPQILGQVRRAYSMALTAGTAGRVLNRLVHQAFHVAKRVRSETGIAASAFSISYMAVELGRKIFDSLSNQAVLIVGAGEMAELTVRHLLNAGVSRILVTNRTFETAQKVAAQFGGLAVEFDRLAHHLSEADIIICSTGAPDYVITPKMARNALEARRNRPSFYIDISVPRNIDPGVGKIPNLFLFDVDDLESVVASNMREREREAERAELIVDAEVMRFQQTLRRMDVGPTLGALKKKLHEIANSEYSRQRSKLGPLTPEQEEAVEKLLTSTVNKIAHPIMDRMRRSHDSGDEGNIKAWREMFSLDESIENSDLDLDDLDS
jgi:glutamyl-tRNA reductase